MLGKQLIVQSRLNAVAARWSGAAAVLTAVAVIADIATKVT